MSSSAAASAVSAMLALSKGESEHSATAAVSPSKLPQKHSEVPRKITFREQLEFKRRKMLLYADSCKKLALVAEETIKNVEQTLIRLTYAEDLAAKYFSESESSLLKKEKQIKTEFESKVLELQCN